MIKKKKCLKIQVLTVRSTQRTVHGKNVSVDIQPASTEHDLLPDSTGQQP